MSRSLSKVYHTIPLHYVPALLASGALYASSVLGSPSRPTGVPEGIVPRPTAARRDQSLGLTDYVHLSLTSKMPLLADKLTRGYSHALLIFDGDAVLALPEVAVLPYNTKAWRTRACYAPVADPMERQAILGRYREGKRMPSLEILVKYGLPLSLMSTIAFVDDRERDAVFNVSRPGLTDTYQVTVDRDLFPVDDGYKPAHWESIADYFYRCRQAGLILPPPSIPFD